MAYIDCSANQSEIQETALRIRVGLYNVPPCIELNIMCARIRSGLGINGQSNMFMSNSSIVCLLPRIVSMLTTPGQSHHQSICTVPELPFSTAAVRDLRVYALSLAGGPIS